MVEEKMGPRLSSREQPRRAAAQAIRGRFREVESLSEDEDDWITPSPRSPKRERDSERRKGDNVDDAERNVDKSGEDTDSDRDEDEYVNRNGKRTGGTLPHLQGSTWMRV